MAWLLGAHEFRGCSRAADLRRHWPGRTVAAGHRIGRIDWFL